MARTLASCLVVGLVAVVASACSTTPQPAAFRTPVRGGVTCDTASAKVVNFGRSTARLNSEIALRQQVSDLRGYMFKSGLRRIQLVQQTSDCSPASVGFASLYQCTARAQLCGR